MTTLQFPSNPKIGDEYDYPPYKYYWDGQKWKTKGIGYNPVNDLRNEVLPTSREAIRRSYAEAGFNLVDGSFEDGGTLTSISDVLLCKTNGEAYSWGGTLPKDVTAKSSPILISPTEWIDRTDVIFRDELASSGGASLIKGPATREFISSHPLPNIPALGEIDGMGERLSVLSSGQVNLSGSTSVKNAKLELAVEMNPVGVISGDGNVVDGVSFSGASGGQVLLLSDAHHTKISNSSFNEQGYQVIQSSGHRADSVSVFDCESIDCHNDFVLANNDFQSGVSYDWKVHGCTVNHKNSSAPWGSTEARGIGFTSVYGAVALGNSMSYVKGDAATHLENTQESVFVGNYYRNNFCDVLFSGPSNRAWVVINTISGVIASGQTITIGAATGEILYWYPNSRLAYVINIAGAIVKNSAYTTSGGASGTIRWSDYVDTHASFIGNIFHLDDISNLHSGSSISLGVNNFSLNSTFIGNTHLAQIPFGSNKVALNGDYSFGVNFIGETWRGWDTAVRFSSSANHRLIGGQYWGNIQHVNIQNSHHVAFNNETYYGGAFSASGLTHSSISECEFNDVTISIAPGANGGNRWSWNKVSPNCVLTRLSPVDFDVWESSSFVKRNNKNSISTSKTVTTTSPQKIASVSKEANNTCAIVEFFVVWRNTATSTQGASSGKMIIKWDSSGVASVTNIGTPIVDSVSVVVSGTGSTVDLNLTASGAAGNNLVSVTCDIVTQGVTVSPSDYLDLY